IPIHQINPPQARSSHPKTPARVQPCRRNRTRIWAAAFLGRRRWAKLGALNAGYAHQFADGDHVDTERGVNQRPPSEMACRKIALGAGWLSAPRSLPLLAIGLCTIANKYQPSSQREFSQYR